MVMGGRSRVKLYDIFIILFALFFSLMHAFVVEQNTLFRLSII